MTPSGASQCILLLMEQVTSLAGKKPGRGKLSWEEIFAWKTSLNFTQIITLRRRRLEFDPPPSPPTDRMFIPQNLQMLYRTRWRQGISHMEGQSSTEEHKKNITYVMFFIDSRTSYLPYSLVFSAV